MLKININSLNNDPEDFSTSVPGLQLGKDVRLISDVEVSCQLHRMHEKVFIRGEVKGRVLLTCSRCLKEYEQDIQNVLFLLAIPKQLSNDHEHLEQENSTDDPVIIAYTGEQLDLLPEIRSSLLLGLPMKPLCRDECPGLCTNCGKPLEKGPCQCSSPEQGGAFSALEDLKKDIG